MLSHLCRRLASVVLLAACADADAVTTYGSSPVFAPEFDGFPSPQPISTVGAPISLIPDATFDQSASAGSAAVFGTVTAAAVSNDEQIFVLDAALREVKVFSPGGDLLTRFGQRGRGPGDFENPTQVLVLPWNGAIAVWDPSLQRFTLFDAAGRVDRTLTLSDAPGDPGLDPEVVQTNQAIQVAGNGFVLESREPPLAPGDSIQHAMLIRLDTAAIAVDTFFMVRVAHVTHTVTRSGGTEHFTFDHPPKFSPTPRWTVLPSGDLVVSPGGRFELFRLGPAGERARRLVADDPMRIVSRNDRLRLIRVEVERGRVGGPPVVVERFIRNQFAPVLPAVGNVVAAGDNHVLVRNYTVLNDPYEDPPEYHLVNLSTAERRPVRVARGVDILAVRGERVYVRETDSDGAQQFGVMKFDALQ